MKATAFSIKPFEKPFLESANEGRHEIQMQAQALSLDSAHLARGSLAVIVFTNDDVSKPVLAALHAAGVRFIATRSAGTDHIDLEGAARLGMGVERVPSYSPEAIAEHAVALALALSRQLITSWNKGQHFDFRNDGLMGFNFSGKTVGLVGLGHTGLAAARIFAGMGCHIKGFDVKAPAAGHGISLCSLDEIYSSADVISLHAPLTPGTKYMINQTSIAAMKGGVMLINTSRGGLLNTRDALEGLKAGKIGYLGLDVYENEKGLFFLDHSKDDLKDPLLSELMKQKNVLITPHQAYLTKEALQQIASQTIEHLDVWEKDTFAPESEKP